MHNFYCCTFGCVWVGWSPESQQLVLPVVTDGPSEECSRSFLCTECHTSVSFLCSSRFVGLIVVHMLNLTTQLCQLVACYSRVLRVKSSHRLQCTLLLVCAFKTFTPVYNFNSFYSYSCAFKNLFMKNNTDLRSVLYSMPCHLQYVDMQCLNYSDIILHIYIK